MGHYLRVSLPLIADRMSTLLKSMQCKRTEMTTDQAILKINIAYEV